MARAAPARSTARAQAWQEIGVDGVFAQCDGKIGVWGKMELTVL